MDADISDLKLAISAISCTGRATESCALAYSEQASTSVLDSQVFHLHVLCEPTTTTASVRRIADLVVSPGLDVKRVQSVFKVDILRTEVLDRLDVIFVLSDGTNSDAESMVKVRIKKSDVGTICLGRERVVAIVDCPVLEEEV